jgi:ATP-binding cassette subfamily B protein/subfamily B ATP-binding cassette protein MsbA
MQKMQTQEMQTQVAAIVHRYGSLLRYPLRHWLVLVAILGLTMIASVVAVLQPLPIKILIDHALGDAVIPASFPTILKSFELTLTPAKLIVVAAVASLGFYVLNATLEVGLNWAWSAVGQRMVYELAESLFQHFQRLSLLFHSRHTVGDFLNRLSGDTYCVYTLSSALIVAPAQHLFTLVTIGLVAWNLDPLLTLLSLTVAPVMAGSALTFGARLKRLTLKNREIQSHLFSLVHQTFTAIPIVQAFVTENRNQQQFRHLTTNAVTLAQRDVLLKNSYDLANGSVSTIGTAVVLYVGGQRVLAGTTTIGSLLVFLAYLQSMQMAFTGLFAIYGKLKSMEANMERVLEVLDAQEGVKETPGAQPLPCDGVRGHIRLEQVSFGYQTGAPVLHHISLEARPGETLALVGATGAGKSTLAALIPRFFDPWQGCVLFDDMDVRSLQLTSLRAQIALVLQEPFLLPLTIAQNIAYARPSASRSDIIAAAQAANAEEFIEQLPQGYDTVLGERGATLSGGQKQRLAIARALLKDAPVLILDEPTSALDTHTEALLLEALERLMAGRTTLIIAHRLSTIRKADQIVVLDQGKIVEMGTHQELLSAQGFYHRLHSLQSSSSPQEVAP